MARQQQKEEHTQVLDDGPIPDVTLPPVSNESAVVADATRKNPVTPVKAPDVQYYRVIKGGPIQAAGYRSVLREGKEIDSVNYDIRALQQQGIRLERVAPEDRLRVGGII